MADDAELVARLQAGDEAAFAVLVERYHASMLRLAGAFVPSRAVAEEVVQDAWLGVVRGIHRFERRSSLRTWLFRILANRARSAGVRERRTTAVPGREPAVDPHRFGPGGQWVDPPSPWSDEVEDRLVAAETVQRIRGLVDTLPEGQRQVLTLRDLEGLSSKEVCEVLEITESNQRVLLHRARSKVRRMLEQDLGKG